jgi:hypothetical protein
MDKIKNMPTIAGVAKYFNTSVEKEEFNIFVSACVRMRGDDIKFVKNYISKGVRKQPQISSSYPDSDMNN